MCWLRVGVVLLAAWSESAAAGWQPGSARQGRRTGMGRSGRLLSNQGFTLVFFASPLIFSQIHLLYVVHSDPTKTENNKYIVKVVLRDKMIMLAGLL